MRELKFRVWDGERYFYQGADSIGFEGDGCYYQIFIQADTCASEVGVFEQYTGLKDCKGVEIYEGDVVRAGYVKGVVRWYDELYWEGGGSAHPGFWISGWWDYEYKELPYHGYLDSRVEVIGNIHENPDLVEEER